MVCTANIARSPLLAELLRHAAGLRPQGRSISIASAGVDARIGDPAATGSQAVAKLLGLSLAQHRSQPLHLVDLDATKLILTMTRRQRRIVTSTSRTDSTRVFAVREFHQALDRMLLAPSSPALSAATDGAHDRLHRLVHLADSQRRSPRLRWYQDVPDPMGHDHRTYEQLAEEFHALSAKFALLLFGPATTA